MKNIAKCKLCKSIIESFHEMDYVTCKCGEIAVYGGNVSLKCSANDFANFLRVDDQGNEIIVKVSNEPLKDSNELQQASNEPPKKPTKAELLNMLDEMIKGIDNLPQNAMQVPITHYDYYSLLLLLSSILRSD